MENAAKALEMAAGVLLAVLIMALVSYFFSSIKNYPEQEDSLKDVEQLASFNREYEVYDKTAMYGTDVISCLNKVKNNNEKYVEGFGFSYGTSYGIFDANKNTYTYLINVKLTIKSPLEESIEIYYNDSISKREQQAFKQEDLKNCLNDTLEDMNFSNLNSSFSSHEYYTTFNKNDRIDSLFSALENDNIRTLDDSSVYLQADTEYEFFNVTGLGKIEIKPQIATLLKMTDNMTQKVTNKNVSGYNDWTSAVWNTAAYSFKKKRFKCDGIVYNESTNRINEISFSEID